MIRICTFVKNTHEYTHTHARTHTKIWARYGNNYTKLLNIYDCIELLVKYKWIYCLFSFDFGFFFLSLSFLFSSLVRCPNTPLQFTLCVYKHAYPPYIVAEMYCLSLSVCMVYGCITIIIIMIIMYCVCVWVHPRRVQSIKHYRRLQISMMNMYGICHLSNSSKLVDIYKWSSVGQWIWDIDCYWKVCLSCVCVCEYVKECTMYDVRVLALLYT